MNMARDKGRRPAESFLARHRKAVLDTAVIALIVLAAYAASGAFDLWERVTEWTRGFERYNLDELFFTLFVVALSLAYVAVRRWREYRHELSVRREAEARAAQIHERLVDAVESVPASFMLFDADDRLVLFNSKTGELFPELVGQLRPGARFEDLARRSADAGMIADAAGRKTAWLDWRLASHRRPGDVFEQQRTDGRWLQVFERKTADGGTVGICTDITELKTHEAGLRRAQKMEAMGRLTGGIAHDFGNLLTIVLGNLQMIEDGNIDSATAAELAGEAMAAAERGTELTGRLLAFARRQPLAPRPVVLGEVLHGMAGLLRRTLGDPIEIETALAEDLWPAVADIGQVESAILNLALNARYAMPDGGQLRIEAANLRLAGDEEGGPDAPAGEYVMLAVSDTGTGMPPEVAERALDPFFTTKPEGKGTGLGLSMVYGFVRQSGGDVRIESEPGRGTTVRLYLPRAEPAPGAGPRVEAAAADAEAGETVLVVEDDPGVRRLAVRLLRRQGFAVCEAENGPQALSILQGGRPVDLLLTDVMMPGGMTGWELAEAARRRRPGLRVLYASAAAESQDAETAPAGVAAALVRKPYKSAELTRMVRRALA